MTCVGTPGDVVSPLDPQVLAEINVNRSSRHNIGHVAYMARRREGTQESVS